MKKYLLIALVLLPIFTKAMDVQMHNTVFWEPANGTYIETYISIFANSIQYAPLGKDKFVGKLGITIYFKKNNKIATYQKYQLNTHVLSDTFHLNFNEIDIKRTVVDTGSYEIELEIRDENSPGSNTILKQNVVVKSPGKEVGISDIELISHYTPADIKHTSLLTKSGFDITPYVINYYPERIDTISFYAELYNTSLVANNQSFLINYYIENADTHLPLEGVNSMAKQSPDMIVALLKEIPIDRVTSGNYNLCIEIRNRENKPVLTKKFFFQRSKEIKHEVMNEGEIDMKYTFVSKFTLEELDYHCRSLRPIADPAGVQFIDNMVKAKKQDTLRMKRFIYNFWSERNPDNPLRPFLDYQEQLNAVNEAFKTQIDYGFQTDRGKAYLKYGPPNERINSTYEANTAPYEMWTYYNLGTQTNVKFIFYQPDMVTNRYKLLHSEAKGEIQNPNWRNDLKKVVSGTPKLDQLNNRENWGENMNNNFQR